VEVPKAISTQHSYETEIVPTEYSRAKAFALVRALEDPEIKNTKVNPVASETACKLLYKLFMKIGATNELPTDYDDALSMLADFWKDMYLKNPLCPDHIPFTIIISAFTTYAVQNSRERRGNNQAAIISQFNEWISHPATKHALIAKKHELYPSSKPAQLTSGTGGVKYAGDPKTFRELSEIETDTIRERIEQLKRLKGIKTADELLQTYENELNQRGE
jgi:hypothetical protein